MTPARVRPFPAPYRAALALVNDVDDTPSPARFLEQMLFLNGAGPTPLGSGLGLELGSTFWFFTDEPTREPFSYFAGTSSMETPAAPSLRALWTSGHVDALHTYGNHTRHGGFRREMARRALDEAARHGAVFRTWVNHGTVHDFQNLEAGHGDLPFFPDIGDRPEEYHADLTLAHGVRFAWMGEVTPVVGQERRLGLGESLGPGVLRAVAGQVGRGAARRLGYRDLLGSAPNYDLLGNQLVRPHRLRDGRSLYRFVRHGDFADGGADSLERTLAPGALDRLVATGGWSLVYVHLGQPPGSEAILPPGAVAALRGLAARREEILVTTTTRLLTLRLAVRHVEARWTDPSRLDIDGIRDPLGLLSGDADALAGLAFALPDGAPADVSPRAYHAGDPVDADVVTADGTRWLQIRRTPLVFPEDVVREQLRRWGRDL